MDAFTKTYRSTFSRLFQQRKDDGGLHVTRADIDNYVTVSSGFALAEMGNSEKFKSSLETLMKVHQLVFHKQNTVTEDPQQEGQMAGCSFTFKEQVQVMRSAHPEKDSAGERTMLNKKLKTWRTNAARLMMYKGSKSNFGGKFKEALAVACLSQRCHALALRVIDKYKEGLILGQTNRKVNAALFREVPGVKTEEAIYAALTKLEEGDITKQEFNSCLKELKINNPSTAETIIIVNGQASPPANQMGEVETLRARIAELEEKLSHCTCQHERETPADVFDFSSEDSDEDMPVMRRPKVHRTYGKVAECEESSGDIAQESSGDEEPPALNPSNTFSGEDVLDHESSGDEEPPALNTSNTISGQDVRDDESSGDEEPPALNTSNTISGQDVRDDEEVQEEKEFSVGERVTASYDEEWFPAKILRRVAGGCEVHWIGHSKNMDCFVPYRNLREDLEEKARELRDGQRVEGYIKKYAGWFAGCIVTKKGPGYQVQFDDGDKAVLVRRNLRIGK